MSQGNIILAGRTLVLGTAAATPGTLSHGGTLADGWMFDGNFTRYFNTVVIANGAVAGLFPMGNSGSDFQPIYVSCPATPPTTGGTINVSVTSDPNASSVSFADDVTVVVRNDGFWTLVTGGGLAGGTYNLRGEGTGFGTVGDVADLRLTLFGSVVGSPGVNAGTTTNPQVNRTALTQANLSNSFYIASVDAAGSPLPIELLNFYAVLTEGIVLLKWTTVTETNNHFFTLERSRNGLSFEGLFKVEGAGNSDVLLGYEAFDREPLIGRSFYRLKQTDFDGTFDYSWVVGIDNNLDASRINLYPNPVSGPNLFLTLQGLEGEVVEFSFLNPVGQLMKLQSITIPGESHTIQIPISMFGSKGIYLLIACGEKGRFVSKFLIP